MLQTSNDAILAKETLQTERGGDSGWSTLSAARLSSSTSWARSIVAVQRRPSCARAGSGRPEEAELAWESISCGSYKECPDAMPGGQSWLG